MDNSANAIVPPEPPGTSAGNAGHGWGNNEVAAGNGKKHSILPEKSAEFSDH